MSKIHDRGGRPTEDLIDTSDRQTEDWELHIDGLRAVLATKGLLNTDQLRRSIESIDPALYDTMAYYERWTVAVEKLLIERGLVTKSEIDQHMPPDAKTTL